MNIKNLTVKNVKSFGDEISIDFQDNLNIFIGPNAGGKSNLMDILNITLIYFFVHSWKAGVQPDEFGGIKRKFLEEHLVFEPINRFLEKHLRKLESSQQIQITFIPEKEDADNIKNVKKFQKELIEFEKIEYGTTYFQSVFFPQLEGFDIDSIIGKKLEFIIVNNNPIQISNIPLENKIFFNYLKFFNLLDLLIEEYNQSIKDDTQKIPVLYPPLAYFSPYRIPQARSLTITLSSVDYFNIIEKHLKGDSKSISSSFEIANYYFAKKLRYLDDKMETFQSEEEIKIINDYVEKLGYKDFGYECKNKEKNIYEGFLTQRDGTKLDLSRASGGEKEIINFLLGIFALNVKNGVVIIDEPELHLHPKWQRILLELFYDFTEKRGIQFFVVTHSPHFITPQSIRSIFRIYLNTDANSQVASPQVLDESEKDLFMLVNIFNNTKVFFADKVILVEGNVDLIIYESILERMQIDTKNSEVIEIIEVQQKGGIEKNKDFLGKWQIKTYGVVDKDKSTQSQGVSILKNGEIENYFQNVVAKEKYHIEDALQIAKKISENIIGIPTELKDIFKNIIGD